MRLRSMRILQKHLVTLVLIAESVEQAPIIESQVQRLKPDFLTKPMPLAVLHCVDQ